MTQSLYIQYSILYIVVFLVYYMMQCCGSGMIYSGSGSGYSLEFSEFRIQANADPDPTYIN